MLTRALFTVMPSSCFLIVCICLFFNLPFYLNFSSCYIEHDTNGTKWKWQSVKLTGTKPSPRTGMSVVANTIGK